MAVRSVIDELVSIFKFETDKGSKKALTELDTSLKAIVSTSLKVGAVLSGVATAIFALDTTTSKSAAKNARLAESYGINIEQLESLQIAIKRLGGAPEDATQALITLKKKFPNFGDPLKQLEALSKEFANLSKNQQNIFAQRFNLSPAIIQLLQEGPTKFADALAKAKLSPAFITKDQFTQLEDASDSVNQLSLAFTGLKNSLVLGTLPAFVKVNEELTKLFTSVQGGDIKKFITDFVGTFEQGAKLIEESVGLINTAVSKIAPPGAVFTDFTKDLKDIKTDAQAAALVVTAFLVPAFGALGVAMLPIAATLTAFVAAVKAIKSLKDLFSSGAASRLSGDVTRAFGAAFGGPADDGSADATSGSLPTARNPFGGILAKLKDSINTDNSVRLGGSTAIPGTSSLVNNAQSASNNISLTNNITVNGTADPNTIALNVENSTRKAISDVLGRGFAGFNRPLAG